MEDYYRIMASRRRLLVVDGDAVALCTFFVLREDREIPTFYDRRCWSTPPDHAQGSIVYFDKLISTRFTKTLWRAIEGRVTDVAPMWERFIWYRPCAGQAPDRRYTYRRRRHGAELHDQVVG